MQPVKMYPEAITRTGMLYKYGSLSNSIATKLKKELLCKREIMPEEELPITS